MNTCVLVLYNCKSTQTLHIRGLTYTDCSPLTLTLHSVTRYLMISSCPSQTASSNMVSPDLVTGAVVGGNTNGNDMNNTTASNKQKLYATQCKKLFGRQFTNTKAISYTLLTHCSHAHTHQTPILMVSQTKGSLNYNYFATAFG